MKVLHGAVFFPATAILLFLSFTIKAGSADEHRSSKLDSLIKAWVALPDSLAGTALLKLDSLLQNDKSLNQFPLSKADLLLEKGRKEQLLGTLNISILSLTNAYKIYEQYPSDEGAVRVLINLAVIYIIRDSPKEAREYLTNALRIKSKVSDMLMTKVYVNLGVTYDMEGQSLAAINFYNKALRFASKANDREALATIYHSIGIAYAMMGQFQQSETYERKALEVGPSEKLKTQILGSLGSFYHEKGETKKAELMLIEAITIAERNGYWDVLRTCRFSLSAVYADMNNYESAYHQLQLHLALKDSFDRQVQNQRLLEQESRFKLDIQRKALELADLKADKQSQWFAMLLILSSMLLILAIISYRNYRLKQKANRLLLTEKQLVELEKRNLEEENLLLQKENLLARFETLRNQINPHFLFNALNSLYALIDVDIHRSKEFVQHFSHLYRLILDFNERPAIELSKEIELINHYGFLQQIRLGNSFRLSIEIAPELLSRSIPPFALQMLIENAVKHNIATIQQPLEVQIKSCIIPETTLEGISVSNNRNLRKLDRTPASGTGLSNIKNRYMLLSDDAIIIEETEHRFTVTLPLLNNTVL